MPGVIFATVSVPYKFDGSIDNYNLLDVFPFSLTVRPTCTTLHRTSWPT